MKQLLDQLAIFGGAPAFAATLHVGRPNVGDRGDLLNRVNEMLDRRWFTNNGPLVQEFERRVADYVGVKHCVAMCNATVALEIAARAAGLRGEVIVPSYTFIATAHSLQWQEITPVFCDMDPKTHLIDPAQVERMITPKTTGIIGVHVWGRPCNIDALSEIARRRNLTLMFDAAHAFGCTHQGRMIGGFGLCEVFSFHATKVLNTFEGGAIVSNDDDFIRKVRLMKNFGFSGVLDEVIYVGTNGKMPEICAAMGLVNIESFDEFVAINRRNYQAYRQELKGIPGLTVLNYDERERCNYHYIVLELDEEQAGLSRDVLVEVLHKENIRARRYFWPGCHRMEPYHSHFPHASLLLPETERVARRVIVMPNGTAIEPVDIRAICRIIRLCVENAVQLKERLARPAELCHA